MSRALAAVKIGAAGGRGRAEWAHTARGLFWVSPWIVGFAAFLALPLGMSFYYSLTDYSVLEKPVWVGLDNYRVLAMDPIFWKVMRNTAIYALFSIPLGTVLAVLIAALLNQKVRGLAFFRAAVFVPTLVPLVAASMVWMWLFNGEYGLINQALNAVFERLNPLLGTHWHGPNWLGEARWGMPALVVMSLWGIGQAVVIYLAALQDVPEQLHEAACIDGLGAAGRFWHVTIPMISPVILFNVVLAIINAWQVFAVPYVMTKGVGGPERSMYFYTHYLYDNAFLFGPKMGYACAMAWIQLLIILALTAITFWVARRYVYYRGV
jgi:multiple sugar transport system permease protein